MNELFDVTESFEKALRKSDFREPQRKFIARPKKTVAKIGGLGAAAAVGATIAGLLIYRNTKKAA